MTERKAGQVWKWHNSAEEWHLCLLLEYVSFDWADQEEQWRILDLDTDRAGRVATAHFRLDQTVYAKETYWELVS